MKRSVSMQHIANRLFDQVKPDSRPGHLTQAMRKLAESVAALEQLAAHRNPTETEEAHARRVAEAAKRVGAKAASTKEYFTVQGGNFRAEIQAEINARCDIAPRSSSAEIRSILRSKPMGERVSILDKAMKENDVEVIAAALTGNTLMTGIDDNVRADFRKHYTAKMAPDLVAEVEALDAVIESSAGFLQEADLTVKEAYSPQYIESIQRAEEQARKVQADFDNAVNG